MFEQMLLPSGDTHQRRNAALAFAGQVGVLAIAAALMTYYDVLPMPLPQIAVPLVLSAPPPPPPSPAAGTRAPLQTAVHKFVPRTFNVPIAPAIIPQHAAIVADAPPALPDVAGAGALGGQLGGVPGGVPGGVAGGSLNGTLGAFAAPPAAAPKPAAAPATPTQIRVGGDVQAARLKHEVMPVYPIIARERPGGRHGPAFRFDRTQWNRAGFAGAQREPTADRSRSERGQTVGLPAHVSERQARRSADRDRRPLRAGISWGHERLHTVTLAVDIGRRRRVPGCGIARRGRDVDLRQSPDEAAQGEVQLHAHPGNGWITCGSPACG